MAKTRTGKASAGTPGGTPGGAALRTLDIDTLWQLWRLGEPSLSPDGAQAVAAATRFRWTDNRSSSTLWLLSTLGGQPRELTTAATRTATRNGARAAT
jgi:dipeptidyl aminopeptidase/acylaminoacyl peptidase